MKLRGKSVFLFLCQTALDSNGSDILCFLVSDAVYFSFQKGRRMCDEQLCNYSSISAGIL